MKQHFKGIIMYPMTVYVLYRWAFSEKQARILMATEIARKQGVDKITVLKYMKDHPIKVKISIETEIKEINDDETGNDSEQAGRRSQMETRMVSEKTGDNSQLSTRV